MRCARIHVGARGRAAPSLEEHLSLKRVMSDLLELATSDDRREAKLFDAAKLSALGEQMTSELARLQDEHPRARIFGRTLSARP